MNKDDWDRRSPCSCYRKITNCPVSFKKILNLKNTGLEIYRHALKPEYENLIAGGVDESVFIFHNTTDTDITLADVLPEMDKNEISCPRCRKIIYDALRILQNVSEINRKEAIGICDHCKLLLLPCCKCEAALKKFSCFKRNTKENVCTKNRVIEWVTKVQGKFRDCLADEKIIRTERLTEAKRLKACSDDKRIDHLCHWEHPKGECKPIREMYRTSEKKRSKEAYITETSKKQCKFDKQHSEGETFFDSKNSLVHQKPKHEDVYESEVFSHKGRFFEETFPPKPVILKRDCYQDGFLSTDHYQQYTRDRFQSATHNRIENIKKLPKKHIEKQMRSISLEESNFGQKVNKSNSINQKKEFSFIFLRNMKDDKEFSRQKSSSELISDIHDRISKNNKETSKTSAIKIKRFKSQTNKKEYFQTKVQVKSKVSKDGLRPQKNKIYALKPEPEDTKTESNEPEPKNLEMQLKEHKSSSTQIKLKSSKEAAESKEPTIVKSQEQIMKTRDIIYKTDRKQNTLSKSGKQFEKKSVVTNKDTTTQILDLLKKQKNIKYTEKSADVDLSGTIKPIRKKDNNAKHKKNYNITDLKKLPASPLSFEINPTTSEKKIKVNEITMLQPSQNYIYLNLVKVKSDEKKNRTLSEIMTMSDCLLHLEEHKNIKCNDCPLCKFSYLELEFESKNMKIQEIQEIVKGRRIRRAGGYKEDKTENKEVIKPLLFQLSYDDTFKAKVIHAAEYNPVMIKHFSDNTEKPVKKTEAVEEETKGIIQFTLSDRSFIKKGWTMLPTEKVVRKMNVYRMRPSRPEFDWFKRNKNKGLMTYDTGETLAEIDDDGRGRWYYKNQRLALQYYDAEELNAQQRFVIFSNGNADASGRARPYTVLATFDYLGNGVVFDHSGKIRMKYNQNEGVLLDRSIGPVSHWKWHNLNDPPALQRIMIDTQMTPKDPRIIELGENPWAKAEKETLSDNEAMLAIEYDNSLKDKCNKLSQSFKPFQIKMKALKINENFSLRILDQANIYLIFRDGTTNIKLNLGMVLDDKEIIDVDTAEVGQVHSNLEKFPARTDSIAAMRKSVAYARRFEGTRTERERRLRPPEPSASADKLYAATSHPIRVPLCVGHSSTTLSPTSKHICRKKLSPNNIYYDCRLG